MLPPDSTPRVLRKLADSRSAEIYTWGDHHIVKLFRLGFPREAIDREAQNAAIVHALQIPTPKPEATVELKGRTGIVFERCAAPTFYELMIRRTQPLTQLAQAFFELQLGIHRCRGPALPAVAASLEDEILRAPVPDAVKQLAIEAMNSMPRGDAVCHGDYHPLNVLLAPSGTIAVDWLDAGTGDPMFDISRSIIYLQFARPGQIDPASRREFLNRYLQCCQDAWAEDIDRLDRWRLPIAVARLATVSDEVEINGLIELIEGDSGARIR